MGTPDGRGRDELWGKVFEPLKQLNLFKKFKISEVMNTIEWENGADISPEFLYEKLIAPNISSRSNASV